ncbi:MAG: sugar transferase [Salinivirgaceae bacterium]|jgi:exopolysaccharide biosynthesis polyprenyl glycosylphosphotransferase|nr:sugar transferase [Salinivirgaceae bacterium]
MKNRLLATKYIVSDFLAAIVAWGSFYTYRKIYVEKLQIDLNTLLDEKTFLLGLTLIPIFWVGLFYFAGEYRNLMRKSRLQELVATFKLALVGSVILFFVLILDDYITSYKNYYGSFFTLFSLQFVLTYIPRLFITSSTIRKIRRGKRYFRTLIIGGRDKAVKLIKDMSHKPKSSGNKFIGFVSIDNTVNPQLAEFLPQLGDSLDDINTIVKEQNIDEVIIALDYNEKDKLEKVISRLELLHTRTLMQPDLYDILTGNVHTTSRYGTPLLTITHELMPPWQENVKRFLDVGLSIIAIIILLPVYIAIAIAVKTNSKGPILYSHERIGRFGKPFTIYKFRSMVVEAEKEGPQLSNKTDSRITSVGRFLRKTRLDETPQFFNVIIGNMSLVGPRPERQFFIDQIVERAPHYYHLLRVRPGITSLGQVKYGYAENVDEMVERLRYDIIYIENMSLYVDFKIMIYTIKTIFEASGK